MTIQELAGLCGLKQAGDVAVGVYKSYPVALRITSGNNRDVLTLDFQLEKAVPIKVVKSIRQSLPKGASVTSASTEMLTVTCICDYRDGGSDSAAFNLARQMLDVSIEVFQNSKKPLMPHLKCVCCGKPDCDSAALVEDSYLLVHRECVINKSQKESGKAQKNEESGNYILGAIGALLGALIGCIPNILLILLTETEYGMLYAIIPFASFFGYKIFRGKLGGTGRVIVIISTLLGFIIMQPVVYFIIFKTQGYDDTFFEIASLYFTNMTIMDILADTWFGIIFLCVGIISGAKTLGTSNHDLIKSANASIDSIIPLNGGYDSTQYAANTYGDSEKQ